MNTRPPFAGALRSAKELAQAIESKTLPPLELVKLMWAERFNLPPNDERLLRATPREALEAIHGRIAFAMLRDKAAERNKRGRHQIPTDMDGEPIPVAAPDGGRRVVQGEEARSLADVPHLTGDPEWDALELSETDPTKPELKVEGTPKPGSLWSGLPRGE